MTSIKRNRIIAVITALVIAIAMIGIVTTPVNSSDKPAKPTNVKITNTKVVKNYGKNGKVTYYVIPTMSWSKVKGASAYKVSVYGTNIKSSTINTSSTTYNSTWFPIQNGKTSGTIKIKVKAYKIYKNKNVYSDWSKEASKKFSWK